MGERDIAKRMPKEATATRKLATTSLSGNVAKSLAVNARSKLLVKVIIILISCPGRTFSVFKLTFILKLSHSSSSLSILLLLH